MKDLKTEEWQCNHSYPEQGWALFLTENGVFEAQKIDELGMLDTDDQALEMASKVEGYFVPSKFIEDHPHPYQVIVLNFCNRQLTSDFQRILDIDGEIKIHAWIEPLSESVYLVVNDIGFQYYNATELLKDVVYLTKLLTNLKKQYVFTEF